MRKKLKYFIIGVIFGSVLIGGISFATDKLQLAVTLPDIKYSFNGAQLNLGDEDNNSNLEQSWPETINYNGVNYVSVRNLAESMGNEVNWDAANQSINMKSVHRPSFEVLVIEDVNLEIQEWIKISLDQQMAQVKIVEEDTYVLITLGKKNTGGHSVKVKDIKQYYDRTNVIIETTDPEKGDIVTEGESYPYTLIKLGGSVNDNIQFLDTDGNTIPVLVGLSYIPSKIKNTKNIVLFEPENTEENVTIHGIVRTFEGLIVNSMLDLDGKVLQFEVIQSKGLAPNWGYFRKVISKEDIVESTKLLIHPFTGDAEAGEERIELLQNELIK